MSNPAAEAVERLNLAWPNNRAWALRGAREALKPIRELHRPVDAHGTGRRCCHTCWDSSGDYMRWPCPTARLIYTAAETTEAGGAE